jgi:diaminohydroxyphosphoribosylaminopyrimidine deaminase/5-amino-6-(5-phosphoribosylamino)uracil reductase
MGDSSGEAQDRAAMRRALELAAQGRGRAWPNPLVGCVVMRDGEVLTEGWHAVVGAEHAEADALARIGFRAEGATMYVTLEPCAHWGRTPPCTDAVLRSGVGRVVVGMVDPHPLVSGKGIEALRAGGLQVDVGVLEDACRALNEIWLVQMRHSRPFVTLKSAITVDGRTATRTGRSKWITGDAARAHVQQERALCQAILVGVGTVLVDDPRLTVRGDDPSQSPIRVVLDSQLRTPSTARLLADDGIRILICTTERGIDDAPEQAAALKLAGAQLLACGPGPRVDLREALTRLLHEGVSSLLVEGGATVHGAFLDARAVDRVLVYVAPKLFGGQNAPGLAAGLGVDAPDDALHLAPFAVQRLGDDIVLESRPLDGPGAADWTTRHGR